MASTRVVFPWSTCAMMATFRMSSRRFMVELCLAFPEASHSLNGARLSGGSSRSRSVELTFYLILNTPACGQVRLP